MCKQFYIFPISGKLKMKSLAYTFAFITSQTFLIFQKVLLQRLKSKQTEQRK